MNKRVSRIKKGLVLFFTLLLVLSMGMVTSADYYLTNELLGTQPVSKTFTVTRTISEIQGLNGELGIDAQDIFIDGNDWLYILDTMNGRVVVLDENDQLVRVIGETKMEETDAEGNIVSVTYEKTLYGSTAENMMAMNKPQGLYVDEIGDLFICDTDNKRILHLTAEGEFVEEFTRPTETTYDSTIEFKPAKVAVDAFGRLLVTIYRDHHGILLIDGNNTFLGYIASTKITSTWLDGLKKIFFGAEQLAQIAKQVPAYFSNFMIKKEGDDSFIYATSHWSDVDQMRKMTPAGGLAIPTNVYGELNDSDQFNNKAGFNDIAVDSRGLMYGGDIVTGKIYVYDQEGQNLAVFGGSGRISGYFEKLTSMAINSKDQLYVFDSQLKTVQVFEPTELMLNIMEATALFSAGKYDEAAIPWANVLAQDSTNFLANVGIAKAAYREGNYQRAMELYEHSFDTAGYSEAFEKYRLGYYRDYFLLVVLIGFVLAFDLYWVISKAKRKADVIAREPLVTTEKMGLRGYLRVTALMFFHPIDCCYGLKRNRKKLSYWPPLLLLFAVIAVRIAYIYAVHFPLASIQTAYADLWQQLGILLLPLLSWIVIGYAMITISDGKQTFKEMFTSTMFSFLPYIVLMLPLAAFSHILCGSEAGVYNLLVYGAWIWSFCLVFVTTKIMNEYSFGKMITTILKIVFCILCAWMIAILFYVIVYQAWFFLYDVYEELILILG